MREIHGVRQDDPTRVARWYSSDACDLFTWSDAIGGELVRFQFCYDKHHDEHLVEWVAGEAGLRHERVDDGESGGPHRFKESPIRIPDASLGGERCLELWRAQADGLPLPVRRFVELKLRELL